MGVTIADFIPRLIEKVITFCADMVGYLIDPIWSFGGWSYTFRLFGLELPFNIPAFELSALGIFSSAFIVGVLGYGIIKFIVGIVTGS